MTQKELSQLYCLSRELGWQQERLGELEQLATSNASRITGMPRSPNIVDRLSQYAAELADLREAIDLNIRRCLRELERLTRYINAVEDSEMRMILSLRYINGLTWLQIAFAIGAHDEQFPRRRHNKFLKNDEKDDPKVI